jgi:molybdate transport system ATP-binding protein
MKTPNPDRPFVSLQHATFRLGDRLVFENTSWVFHRDEHWAVIGANGAGKSLFADALRARLPLVQGELQYHFRPIPGLSREDSIGHVSFEDRKSDFRGTVVQSRWNSIEEEGALLVRDFLSYERVMDVNPFEVTRRHGKARRAFDHRRHRAIGLLRLEPLLDRRLISLSNGETQRVQLARALSHSMRLLILDEPFIGLDTATRAQFHAALERLMGNSLRVLIITTRLEDLPAHVTHLLVVDRCQIVAAGPRVKILRSLSRRDHAGHYSLPFRRGEGQGEGFIPSPRARTAMTQHPASSTLVELRNVTVRYGSVVILRDITWTVRAGESWALLGPNGSGKSTLLSLILGDNPQAFGNDISFFGKPRGYGESIWDLKKHIGWVSPELHLHFNDSATCFEVVASGFYDSIGLFEPPTKRQRAAVRHGLAKFDLLDLAQTPLFALSVGLQRMVFLARALVKRPRLLILDEPCQGLDLAHRKLFVNTVNSLIRVGGVTTIYVTHRPDEIPPSICRVLRLPTNHGTLPKLIPLVLFFILVLENLVAGSVLGYW